MCECKERSMVPYEDYSEAADEAEKAQAAIERVRRFVQSHCGVLGDDLYVEGAAILALLDQED